MPFTSQIQTSKDFSQVFLAYTKFEEMLITLVAEDNEDEEDIDDAELAAKLNRILKIEDDPTPITLNDEIELKLQRLELLLERRPILLNSC